MRARMAPIALAAFFATSTQEPPSSSSIDGQWQGRLFVPDQKLRVRAKIVLIGEQQLKVSGCAVAICKSQLWNRSTQPIPAVSSPAAIHPAAS